MSLFSDVAIDEVTVQDIAAEVEMTPAAVYYHFASKEQILYEGIKQFTDELVSSVVTSVANEPHWSPGQVLEVTLAWIRNEDPLATVYFVSSVGLNQSVEALRRNVQIRLVEELRTLAGRQDPSIPAAQVSVAAVAFVSLLETSAASMLSRDQAHRGLGSKRFVAEVRALADRISGVAN